MSRPTPEIARQPARHASVVSLDEAGAMLRLCNVLHASDGESAARKELLLEGLCGLLLADAGVCVIVQGPPAGAATTVVAMARWRMTERDAEACAARYAAVRHAGGRRRNRNAGGNGNGNGDRNGEGVDGSDAGDAAACLTAEHCVEPPGVATGLALRACVTLIRRPPGARRFSQREAALLAVVHSEMAWLYRADLPPDLPAGLALSPRERQTLQLLLAGHAEKEIATQLGLSHNTVHHYVKAIHRHFHVSTRSELLARWVRK